VPTCYKSASEFEEAIILLERGHQKKIGILSACGDEGKEPSGAAAKKIWEEKKLELATLPGRKDGAAVYGRFESLFTVSREKKRSMMNSICN